VGVPEIGQSYRGVDGHSGYLLRQAWHAFRGAMEQALRPYGLTSAQFAVLSVLARSPGASNADLARACNTTPQAMIGVLATLERAGLTRRHPHPTHGRILQVTLSAVGRQRLESAQPAVRELEREAERGLSAADLTTIKAWLVTTGKRLERPTTSRVDRSPT